MSTLQPGQVVLVTGAGGFLGAALARRLLGAGLRVHGTTRSTPLPEGVEPLGPSLEVALDELRPAVVWNLAWTVTPSRDPRGYEAQLDSVGHADRLARACLERDLRLVHVGTCEEYGDGPAPFHEDQPPRPVSPYSAAKLAATEWVRSLARNQGLRATVARPFLTYGPGQDRARLVPGAIEAALSGQSFPMSQGLQTRELTFVEDMVEGLVHAAEPEAEGALLNLGSGHEHTVHAVVQRVFELCEADPGLIQRGALPTRSGEVPRFVGDHGRARSLLRWRPTVSLDEGLRRTIAAMRAAG